MLIDRWTIYIYHKALLLTSVFVEEGLYDFVPTDFRKLVAYFVQGLIYNFDIFL